MNVKIVTLLVVLFVMPFVAADTDAGVAGVEVTDRVDRDGDGYLSSFTVDFSATTNINDAGNFFKPMAFQNKGEPKVMVIDSTESLKALKVKQVGYDERFPPQTISLQQLNDDGHGIAFDKLRTGKPIESITVGFYESDSNRWEVDPRKDEELDTASLDLSEPIRMEPDSQDKLATVTVEANVDGASVYINGEDQGTTPWTGEFPVDSAERQGKTTINVMRKGYLLDSFNGHLNPPETQRFNLNKVTQPLVVSSDPSGATVTVNGNEVGTTPVSEEYWVRESLDVNVSNENASRTYDDVTTKKTIHAVLNQSGSDSYEPMTGTYVPDFDMTMLQLQDITDYLSGLDVVMVNFTATPRKPTVGDTVTFDASPSFDLSGDIQGYEWTFGDGDTDTGERVTHQYDKQGTYTVKLDVTDANGTIHTNTRTVTVTNARPMAEFRQSTQPVETGTAVTFDAAPSTDPTGIVAYEWRVDGSTEAQGQTFTRTFPEPGTYSVELSVADTDGATDTETRRLRVEEANEPPTASMSVSPRTVSPNETVTFDATASTDDEAIAAYAWSFGDGETARAERIEHAFPEPGEYEVTLTVRDGDTAMDSVTKTITVEADDSAGATQTDERVESEDTQEDESTENRSEDTQQENSMSDRSAVAMIVQGICQLFGLC